MASSEINQPVLVETNLSWNAALAALYGFMLLSCLVLGQLGYRKQYHLSSAGWYFLGAVRIIQAVLGFNLDAIIDAAQRSSRLTSNHDAGLIVAYILPICITFLWDLGFYILVHISLRDLKRYLDNARQLFGFAYFIYSWSWLLLLASYVIACLPPTIISDSDKLYRDLGLASRYMHWAWTILVIVALLASIAGWITTAIRRRRGTTNENSPIAAVALAYTISLPILLARSGSDIARVWTEHVPTFAEFIGAGLVPEAVAAVAWLIITTVLSDWVRRLEKQAEGVRRVALERWTQAISVVYDTSCRVTVGVGSPGYSRQTLLATATPSKTEDLVSRLVSSQCSLVLLFLSDPDRVIRLLRQLPTAPHTRDQVTFLVGAIVEHDRDRLLAVARLVTCSIALSPADHLPLTSTDPRPIDIELTTERAASAVAAAGESAMIFNSNGNNIPMGVLELLLQDLTTMAIVGDFVV